MTKKMSIDGNYGFRFEDEQKSRVTAFNPRTVFDNAGYLHVNSIKVSTLKPKKYDLIAKNVKVKVFIADYAFEIKGFKKPFYFCKKELENIFGKNIRKLYIKILK